MCAGRDAASLAWVTEALLPAPQQPAAAGTRPEGNGMGVAIFDSAEHAAGAQEALEPAPRGPELISTGIYVVGATD